MAKQSKTTKVNASVKTRRGSANVKVTKPTFNSDPFPHKIEPGFRGLVRDLSRNSRKKQQMKNQIARYTKAPRIISATGHAVAEASAPWATSNAYAKKLDSITPATVILDQGSLRNDEQDALPNASNNYNDYGSSSNPRMTSR